jgi:hypothetical protein
MPNNIVNFGSRTFDEIRAELVEFVREQYPDTLQDFTDSSVGAMLLDLNAGVANNLSVNTDRAFQETQLENAQQRRSLFNIAKNLGFKIPGNRPSVTVVDFSVNVPARGDQPDPDYLPIILAGSQVVGGGQTFETDQPIDFNSPLSNLGDPNRSFFPVLDANGIIQSYRVIKREVVINGATRIFRRSITDADVVPFLQLQLPDVNVISIDSAILLQGTNFIGDPPDAEFSNFDNRYYEVDFLAQQRVFLEDIDGGTNVATTGNTGLKAAKWVDVTQKFIKEFTPNGFCVLTFGGGNGDLDIFKDGLIAQGVSNRAFLDNFLTNTSLGEQLRRNHTLFVRYRVGGGSASNIGTGVLTATGNFNMQVNGPRQDINNTVRRSIQVNNPIPAVGGNNGLNNEQIRNLIKFNFSSQFRDVTINDYLQQVFRIPGRFGSPFRANAFKENNKVVIPILGLGSDGKLSNTSNTLLKDNISEYLTEFRMVNDYIEIRDGRIFNIGFEVDIFIEERNENAVANDVITSVRNFFDINRRQMNEDIPLAPLEMEILGINGVVNILGIRVFNKVGGQYSVNVVEQDLVSEATGEIQLINNTIYSTEDSMFEIKFPERDIVVNVRTRTNLGV